MDAPNERPKMPAQSARVVLRIDLDKIALQETATTLSIFEVCLVLGYLNRLRRRSRDDEQSSLAFGTVRASYDRFIRRRYGALVAWLAVAPVLAPIFIVRPGEEALPPSLDWWFEFMGRHRREAEPADKLNVLAELRGLEGTEFGFEDFRAWVSAEYGEGILQVKRIEEGNSWDFILDATQFAIMAGFQQYPLFKDTLTLSLDILRRYMRRDRGPTQELLIPELPEHMARTVALYDDVEIKVSRTEARFHLHRSRKRRRTRFKRRR